MRQVTDATDPSYLHRRLRRSSAIGAGTFAGWLGGGFQSVPRRVSTVPGSLLLGL